MNYKFLKILMLPFLLLLVACPEEEVPVKPDPCDGEVPFSADFHIYEAHESFPENWVYYDTDTVGIPSVIFHALNDNANYEWHLGSEIITERTFTRMYFPINEFIPVTLIARRKKDTGCFPDEKEIDTVTRYFYTLGITEDGCYENNVNEGTFVGYNNDNPDSLFQIEYDICFKPNGGTSVFDNELKLNYLINGLTIESKHFWRRHVGSYKETYAISYIYDKYAPEVLIRIFGKGNDSIRVDYNLQRKPGVEYLKDRIEKTFIGWRLK